MHTIYIEQAIRNHPTTQKVLQKLGQNVEIIECRHFGEIFNPKSQNFRIQKQNPALILAQKTGQLVLPTPKTFGIGGEHNYYFSHMLNCLYDCRYCFLQGMYSSAHYVFFVNYKDFMWAIDDLLQKHREQRLYFFSGYDCDSLAYEPVTQFVQSFLPFFAKRPQAILELRTKSINIRELMHFPAFKNVIVAYSLTPEIIAKQVEHKAPSIKKRLEALKKLATAGWPVGIRLDPLIYADNYKLLYQQLIEHIFEYIAPEDVHSISLGPLRFPEKMYQRISNLYPKDVLLAHPLYKRGGYISYRQEIELEMKHFVMQMLSRYVSEKLLFTCSPL